MGLATALQLAGLLASSFFVAISVLSLLGWLDRRTRLKTGFAANPDIDGMVFLFDEETLVDATSRARNLMGSGGEGATDWMQLTSLLQPQFPDLSKDIAALAEKGSVSLSASSGTATLKGQWLNGLARITLHGFGDGQPDVMLDQPSYDAIHQELDTLRSTAATAPFLVWRQNGKGSIVWANKSYISLARSPKLNDGVNPWPPRNLFGVKNTSPAPSKLASQRVSTTISGEADPRWFECFETPLGDDSLFTAVSADKVVKAETALNEFVQTLTKTFAHLKIGLAIFDKQRRLALFNPALVDLTTLRPEFLTGQPSLQAVLDQLRNKQVLPEPKDYKSWRRQIYDLEVAAVNGTYEETWSLPNGRTFRVNGQPHPDGALAFLIEDISAEISLTRQFRAELDISQAILDSLSEAIAIFSPTGQLTVTNSAYHNLWGIGNEGLLAPADILATTKEWSEKCAPSPVWGDAREFVGSLAGRVEWTADLQLLDGRNLRGRFSPISGGSTIIGFSTPSAGKSGTPIDAPQEISNVSTVNA